jgi:uncharacterized hydrophobic protein (TIGR00271 family)
MFELEQADVDRMRDELFFEGEARSKKLTKFWTLLILSAFIAGAGVVSDSTATVIGAMIVAPLMTPILGVVLGIVLTDRRNLARSLLLVLAGALVVIAIGFLLGLAVPYGITAENNSQVAGRISPRVMDLVAALATGAVGSVALARSDISDTLPGVAIAISLVPPLSVVGLTLEAGAFTQARGALLLFGTNVVAILASGVVVMALYRVHLHAAARESRRRDSRKGAIAAIAVLVVLVAIPLSFTSREISKANLEVAEVHSVLDPWARHTGWTVLSVAPVRGGVLVRVSGPLPEPSIATLHGQLEAKGLGSNHVTLQLVPARTITLTGS